MAMHGGFQGEMIARERCQKYNIRKKKYVVAFYLTIDPRHNKLDPAKLLLALALRTGAVDVLSIDQIISPALALANRTVR
jgi:hypothetical protein